jgi:hypothetical protein
MNYKFILMNFLMLKYEVVRSCKQICGCDLAHQWNGN